MTDVPDLIAWLRAQLDEDERAAKAWLPFGNPTTADRKHIARWDPARVLAEVDAKRKLLDLHPHERIATLPEGWPDHWKAEVRQAFPGTPEPYIGCRACDWDARYEMVEPDWWCQHVRLLALPYADRPGYRPEWRPE